MNRDNERQEAFAFWNDPRVKAYGSDNKIVEVLVEAGIVVNDKGVCLRVEGARGEFAWKYMDREQECALYEALRVRFDEKHRAAVEQAALAKLSPLEQDALRRRWGGKGKVSS